MLIDPHIKRLKEMTCMTRELIRDNIEHCTIPNELGIIMSWEAIHKKHSPYWKIFSDFLEARKAISCNQVSLVISGPSPNHCSIVKSSKSLLFAKVYILKCCSHWRALWLLLNPVSVCVRIISSSVSAKAYYSSKDFIAKIRKELIACPMVLIASTAVIDSLFPRW